MYKKNKSGKSFYNKRDDYKSSSRGFKTPYYESKGWSASESHIQSGSDSLLGKKVSYPSRFFTSSEANANRTHESIEATHARFYAEHENWANRRHQLKVKWGPLFHLLDDYRR